MLRERLRTLLAATALVAASAAAPATAAERALLVGIDAYAAPSLAKGNLGAAARDVERVGDLLTGTLGYDPSAIRVLVDGAATRAAILDNLSSWLGESGPGDHVFFYYSGLGHFAKDANGDEADELDETLVPVDAKEGATPGTLEGLITDDEVMAALAKLKGRKITVVLDAGFSGRVTRGSGEASVQGTRAPVEAVKTRKIVVEPSAQAQKADPAVFEEVPADIDASVWTAASASQLPLVDPPKKGKAVGVFTDLYAKGLADKAADANGNGVVSNAELLAFVRKGSAEICARRKADCEMGLVPALGPDEKLAAVPDRVVRSEAGPPPAVAPAKLTADKITDIVGAKIDGSLVIEQLPGSPVPVGTRDVRFRITSTVDGFLVLLSLDDNGTLTQLFPNQFSRERVKDGRIRAGHQLTVPDAYYGFRINATAPSSGTLIAVLLSEPPGKPGGELALPPSVKTRKIEVIPAEEAEKTLLPELAKAGERLDAGKAGTNTFTAGRHVAVLRYAIVKP